MALGTLKGFLFAPGDVCTETWATHFTGNTWTTIQDQITAGFPLYMQPTPVGTSTWVKEIDYEVLLPPTVATVSIDNDILAGVVTAAVTISHKEAALDEWTDMPVGAQVFLPAFRYVKVSVAFSATTTAGLMRVNDVRVRLDVKMKVDSGHIDVANTGAGGDPVTFNISFLDVESITLTPGGTAPRYAVYDFNDVPNPTGFDVYLFDLDGTRVTGRVSWTARGV